MCCTSDPTCLFSLLVSPNFLQIVCLRTCDGSARIDAHTCSAPSLLTVIQAPRLLSCALPFPYSTSFLQKPNLVRELSTYMVSPTLGFCSSLHLLHTVWLLPPRGSQKSLSLKLQIISWLLNPADIFEALLTHWTLLMCVPSLAPVTKGLSLECPTSLDTLYSRHGLLVFTLPIKFWLVYPSHASLAAWNVSS